MICLSMIHPPPINYYSTTTTTDYPPLPSSQNQTLSKTKHRTLNSISSFLTNIYMAYHQSLKLGLRMLLLMMISLSGLNFDAIIIPTSHALNLGVQANAGDLSLGQDQCSRICESSFCKVGPLLRYGKYCGLLYGGCPGEKPCDALDACCMKHDSCILSHNNDYLNQECNQNLLNCIDNFKRSGGKSFNGNTCELDDVIQVITVTMDAALLAGRVLHKP